MDTISDLQIKFYWFLDCSLSLGVIHIVFRQGCFSAQDLLMGGEDPLPVREIFGQPISPWLCPIALHCVALPE